ncbi:MAG: bifunctional phosphopantothenoylcysteine decarboxylase/phosphopantothenate--cysteine ligase CoaBC [Coriobacteriales bacterium]|jgi:phosphopantothenoylcysteine decarboxylase/phosphopantothenate--cysteine ligase|nr:bifunctional phosphopantothenoylcysteine decarboxylase/phosphopantothenate--cysteine ligase CoaBC [Coriobacteriales bacterium]
MKQQQQQQQQQTVLLGVTGSIAAYKACELLRLLQKAGLRVKVALTEHAQELVGAATFRALSGEPVATSLFDSPGNPINHISLAEEASVLVIAPCTANVLNKLASGVADDLLTTTALATTAPLVLAPAMNARMLRHPRTQASLELLEAAGATLVGPGEGYLACGEEDSGRMSSPEDVCAATLEVLARTQSLAGKRVLITAGPTREYLDPVRFISSPSSGKTGFALAREAAARGASVVLVSGPTDLTSPPGVEYVPVVTARQMLEAASEHFDTCDLAIFSAAVADFRPAEQASQKLKKGASLPSVVPDNDPATVSPAGASLASVASGTASASYSLTLTANPDILATLAARRAATGAKRPYLVGFAAETEDLLSNAREKLKAKGADLIVANDVSDPALGFASSHNQLSFVSKEGSSQTAVLSKEHLARHILDTLTPELC